MIDTGYDDDLLIPQVHFDILGFSLSLDLDSGFWKAETVSGEKMDLKSSQAVIKLGTKKIPVQIESYDGNKALLIGRGLLARLQTLIDGIEGKTCIIER